MNDTTEALDETAGQTVTDEPTPDTQAEAERPTVSVQESDDTALKVAQFVENHLNEQKRGPEYAIFIVQAQTCIGEDGKKTVRVSKSFMYEGESLRASLAHRIAETSMGIAIKIMTGADLCDDDCDCNKEEK